MNLMLVCSSFCLLGVEVGWEPMPRGGVEYVIQLEPQVLDALRSGDVVRSDLKPEVKDIRAFRIQTGTQPPRRELPPAETKDPPPRPWVALTLTMILLFGSLGGNVFLGWTSWDFRRRYQQFLAGNGAVKSDKASADAAMDAPDEADDAPESTDAPEVS